MRSKPKACLMGTLVLIVAIGTSTRFDAAPVEAQGADVNDHGTFTIIDVPGASTNSALDINAEGVIVGRYVTAGRTHGFVRSATGEFTTLDVPGSIFTSPTSINDRGDIVGQYALPTAPNDRHGFLLKDGEFTSFDPPGSRFTNALAINERGDIVGRYCTVAKCTLPGTGVFHGFLLHDGEFTPIDVPGAIETDAFGVNGRGAVAGGFLTSQNQEQIFVQGDDGFTVLALPGGQAVSLDKGSINERGDVVGAYCNGAAPCLITLTSSHGFLISAGTFTPIDISGARATAAFGINARGDIVGAYSDGIRFHGFLLNVH